MSYTPEVNETPPANDAAVHSGMNDADAAAIWHGHFCCAIILPQWYGQRSPVDYPVKLAFGNLLPRYVNSRCHEHGCSGSKIINIPIHPSEHMKSITRIVVGDCSIAFARQCRELIEAAPK